MLRHRIEGEDIGAVEGVQRGGLQQDIPDVFVAGGIVLKQPVQRLLLVSIVFQFMPLGEIPPDLLRAGRRNVRSLPTLPSGRALLRLLREGEAAEPSEMGQIPVEIPLHVPGPSLPQRRPQPLRGGGLKILPLQHRPEIQ